MLRGSLLHPVAVACFFTVKRIVRILAVKNLGEPMEKIEKRDTDNRENKDLQDFISPRPVKPAFRRQDRGEDKDTAGGKKIAQGNQGYLVNRLVDGQMSGYDLEEEEQHQVDHRVETEKNAGEDIHDQAEQQGEHRTFVDIEVGAKKNNKEKQKIGPAEPLRQDMEQSGLQDEEDGP